MGTILAAQALGDPTRIKMYKLEKFESEWYRLGVDTGCSAIVSTSKNTTFKRQFQQHKTMFDVLDTTRAAKTYFSLIDDNLDSGDPTYLNSLTPEELLEYKIRLSYYRATCRMYFIDFLCANYTLPPACMDMYADLTPINISKVLRCSVCQDTTMSKLPDGRHCCRHNTLIKV